MKKLSIALLFSFATAFAFSQDLHFKSGKEKQQNKPQLFAKEASRFSVRPEFFNQMLSSRVQQQVAITITPKTVFRGTVTAITHDAPGLETIIMKSTETPGLVLSLSRLEIAGEGVTYRGMMMGTGYSDMLMLEKDPATGSYVWNKKEIAHMIPD
jgi:hypothetical protein